MKGCTDGLDDTYGCEEDGNEFEVAMKMFLDITPRKAPPNAKLGGVSNSAAMMINDRRNRMVAAIMVD